MFVCALVVCIIMLAVILVYRRLDYFASRGLPYVKPTLKSFCQSFSPSFMGEYPLKLYKNEEGKNGSIIGFFQTFLQPTLLVLDSSTAEEIFIKKFSSFHDRGINLDTSRDPLASNLFNMIGEKWRSFRSVMLPSFTSGKLKGMIPAMEECARSLVEDMKKDIENSKQDVDVHKLFRKFTLSAIASCAFGLEPESVKDPDCEFQKIFYDMLKDMTVATQLKFVIIFFFPKIAALFQLKIFPKHVDDFIIKLTKDTIKMRQSSNFKRNDYIQLLLELREKGSIQVDNRDLEEDEKNLMKLQQQLVEADSSTTKIEMTDELLAAQSFIFIAAGFDNAAYIIAITSYLLSKNKDIQDRIREEIKMATKKHGTFNYLALRDMKLLEGSINEALRIYPPVFVHFRVCTKSCTLRSGLKIEKGMNIIIPAKAIQNDKTYWPDPEKFNPDRFNDNVLQPGTYMPFGDGPRLCIGQRITILMAKIMLAVLLGDYLILPSDKTVEPLKPKVMVSSEIKGGLWSRFQLASTTGGN